MKKIFTILTAVLITATIWAQSPEKMTYQSVIRNASDQLVTNQGMGMQISILQGSANGTAVYVETHSTTSNANGLVTIEIGTGATSDDFSSIDWENGPYFLKSETDPTTSGGTNYTITGTSQLLSVPYALYAKTASTADYNNLTNLPALNIANWDNAYNWGDHSTAGYLTSFTETDPVYTANFDLSSATNGDLLKFDGTKFIKFTPNYLTSFTEVDGSTTNEIQNLNSVLNTGSDANSVAINNLKIGQSSTCDASTEGNQRYNSVTKKMEYCDGTQWIPYSTGVQCTPQPTVSNAGTDQLNIVGTSCSLSANTPVEGSGIWTIKSGTNGSFVSNTLSTTDFNGLIGHTYILTWTISNECYSSSDDVIISFEPITSVTDIDGNVYNIVSIGSQVWMKENLKVTHYADGTSIPLITDNSAWANLGSNNTDDAYCYYNNNPDSEYGALYTWAAAMGDNAVSSNNIPSGVQGVCPDGWHLPSDAEWSILTDYLGNDSGSKLADNADLWTDGNLENNAFFGTSGFFAIPAGYRLGNGYFYNIGNRSIWWSSFKESSEYAWHRSIIYNNTATDRDSGSKSNGFSVRCVKD